MITGELVDHGKWLSMNQAYLEMEMWIYVPRKISNKI